MAIAEGSVLQDTYEIVRRVGQGGMGEVYEARHARLPGRFAVKVLLREVAENPEAFARFQREAETTSALRHPHIVQVVDFNRLPDGAPYLVMEFLEGIDLGTCLRIEGRMHPTKVAEVVGQIASALAAAHSKSIVHRDLKPQNIFLVPVAGQNKEIVKVVDFGISKVRSATTNLTRESTILGTPQYMSPEQALGRGDEVDARTDQFALALIAYEMLAGQVAFTGDSVPSILYKVVHEEPPRIGDKLGPVGKALDAVLRQALAKNREHRFAGVLDFAAALDAAASQAERPALGTAARRSPPPSGLDATVRRDASAEGITPSPPSTFSSTASEPLASGATDAPPPSRRRLLLTVTGGALVAAAVFAVPAALSSRRPAAAPGPAPTHTHARPPAPAPRPVPAAAEPVAPSSVAHVSLDSRPQGATVTAGAQRLGETPCLVDLPRGTEILELVFKKDGYRPASLKVIPDMDKSAAPVELQARSRAAPPAGPGRRSFVDDL